MGPWQILPRASARFWRILFRSWGPFCGGYCYTFEGWNSTHQLNFFHSNRVELLLYTFQPLKLTSEPKMSGNMKSSSNHLCKHLCRRCTLQDLEVSTKVWRCERFLLNIPTGWDGCNTVIFTGCLGSFNVSTSTGWWGTTLSFFRLAAGDALISEALCCWRIPSALPCFFRALHCDFLQGKLRPSSPLAPDNRTRAHHQQKINK